MSEETTQHEAPESIMRRIQSLLELAGHANTPEHERTAAQERADRLMAKYRLDRAMLNFTDKTDLNRIPVHREYDIIKLYSDEAAQTNRDWSEELGIQTEINYLRTDVYHHTGCRTYTRFKKITVVGYEEDIFYGDMLWMTIFSDVVTRIFPTWKMDIGFDENVFNLKNAGFSWPQVREMGLAKNAADKTGYLTADNAGSKLRTAYKRHCKKVGFEPPKTQPRNPGLWRRSFVDSYSSQLRSRMLDMKMANEEAAGKEGEIALVKDADRVREEFYKLFPNMDPRNAPKLDPNIKYVKVPLGKFKMPKQRATDMSAWAAGRSAADSVNLSNNKAAGHKKGEIG